MSKKFTVIIPDETDYAELIKLAFDLSVNPRIMRGEANSGDSTLSYMEARDIFKSTAGLGQFHDYYKTRQQYLWVDYVKGRRVKLNVDYYPKEDQYYIDSYWTGHSETKTRKLFEFLGYTKEQAANSAGFFEKKRPPGLEIY